MGIKESTIKRIREIPLTEILKAEGIAFKKIGKEAITLCPWHADSNPSLTINDDKGMCFCFACGGGSDAISYVRQKFSIDFSDAVNRIADKHSISVEYDNLDPEEAYRLALQRKNALDQIKAEHSTFRDGIKSTGGLQAREWLRFRGIKASTSKEFELGWAQSGYFAGRVTIPIHDHRGNLIGFTGRQIYDSQSSQKYKNSKSSEIFDKSAILFNEHRAVEAARLSGYMVFVEGHFDVISMHQYGIKNVVAIQGTAAPLPQTIKRLSRTCKRFVLCYDGDSGGLKAIEHFVKVAGPMACQGELTLTVAQLPSGKDPDDCIREDTDLHSLIESAPQWLDWQLDCWLANIDRSDTQGFSAIEQAVRNLVESIRSPALRQFYIDKAAKILAADQKAAVKLAVNWNKSLPKIRHSGVWQKPSPSWVRNQVEKRVLRYYVHFPNDRARLRPLMDKLQGPSHLWLWNRIVELENYAESVTVDMLMVFLVICEPQYTRSLRAIISPTIKLQANEGILCHAEQVLGETLTIDQ
jgi:DNA primase